MSHYIETGELKGKAHWLKQNAKGIYLAGRPTEVNSMFVPICIVDNGEFEAAAIATTPHEAAAFDIKSDVRPKTWMLITAEDAVRLCPKVSGHINWSKK